MQTGGDLYASGSALVGGDGIFQQCIFMRNGGGAGLVLDSSAGFPALISQGTIDASGTLNVTIPGAPITISGAFDIYVDQPSSSMARD